MRLFISSINSGSNGNCYYVGNERDAVLIDAGISCREIERRMSRLGLSMDKVRAIFVSHEHGDHIRGIETLSKKYRLPVYITPGTMQHGGLRLTEADVRSFAADMPVAVGSLSVIPFSKHHDASEPHSFVVEYQGITVGVFTDIGRVCDQLIRYFKNCHAAFLEANYDELLLANGRYPYFLKQRITGGKGHLSNRQAFELFCTHRPDYMSHLLLSHLSKDNNDPELARTLFLSNARGTEIVVASRYEASAVYTVGSEAPPVKDVQLALGF